MLLDSCFCIDLFREKARGQFGPAQRKLAELEERKIYLSLFSLCELKSGALLSRNPQAELRKVELLTNFAEVIYPNTSFSVIYSELEAHLRQNGQPIPVMDLLIAVTAKAAGLPLLTKDFDHFKRIPGLVVEVY